MMTAERGEEGYRSTHSRRPADISLLHLDIRLGALPWRLTPAWVVGIAALTVAGWAGTRDQALTILLMAFVADAIWGGWWRLATTPSSPHGQDAPLPLPYAQPGAPWARVHTLFARGTFSSLLITGLLLGGIAYRFMPDIVWWSALAFLLAMAAWWARHVYAQALLWLEPVFMAALPFAATAYVVGALSLRTGTLALALTAGRWALHGTRWRRAVWGTLAFVAWAGALVGHVPPIVVGGTAGVLFITLFSNQGVSTATDLGWLGALLAQAIAQ